MGENQQYTKIQNHSPARGLAQVNFHKPLQNGDGKSFTITYVHSDIFKNIRKVS